MIQTDRNQMATGFEDSRNLCHLQIDVSRVLIRNQMFWQISWRSAFARGKTCRLEVQTIQIHS